MAAQAMGLRAHTCFIWTCFHAVLLQSGGKPEKTRGDCLIALRLEQQSGLWVLLCCLANAESQVDVQRVRFRRIIGGGRPALHEYPGYYALIPGVQYLARYAFVCVSPVVATREHLLPRILHLMKFEPRCSCNDRTSISRSYRFILGILGNAAPKIGRVGSV
ncbi:uncharacterized protein B0T15DRAFT_510327 [Chaetomium strumarium]|uniref:Secreted protein n=1 Tax=Chaetomium strumarium TaxID=1170767 RepID=A0AAJ0GVU3_9PEZI|nr:hypothetical protein B0T15DRAFT_510327 [Chaetomium strumarium]